MCLIVVQPTQALRLSPDEIELAFSTHGDGAGLAYSCRGDLILDKPYYRVEDFQEAYDTAWTYRDRGAILLHFRQATHGHHGPENVHPFPLCKGRIALAHNGILPAPSVSLLNNDASMSDTAYWCATVFWGRSPRVLMDKRFVRHMSKMVGFNKLAWIDQKGHFRIVNMKMGDWLNGSWYSNTWHLHTPTAYGYAEPGSIFAEREEIEEALNPSYGRRLISRYIRTP